MKKIAFGTVAAFFLGGSALAADLPVKAPMYQAPPSAVYNWGGFYVGGNVGWGWLSSNSDAYRISDGSYTGSGSQDQNGFLGGGQVGYNFMITPNFLIGIEGDIDWADLTGSDDACSGTGCSHSDGKTDWIATIRGRVGYAVNDLLFFATGGAAWTHSSNTRTITVATNPSLVGQSADASSTNSGWTAGGGVEYGFAPHWSAVLEYRYIDVSGSKDYYYPSSVADRHVDATAKLNIVRFGVNYHF